jgi:hypothetical protein
MEQRLEVEHLPPSDATRSTSRFSSCQCAAGERLCLVVLRCLRHYAQPTRTGSSHEQAITPSRVVVQLQRSSEVPPARFEVADLRIRAERAKSFRLSYAEWHRRD